MNSKGGNTQQKDYVMWDRTDQVIRGEYCGASYRGVVRNSRVKLGGTPQHTVDLLDSIIVYGNPKDIILVLETEDFVVECENYHDCNV